MHIELIRYGSTPDGTFGEITIGGQLFYTIEQPWNDNAKGASCVPLGEYELVWQPTTTSVPNSYNGNTWYLKGDTVTHTNGHNSDKPRTRVAIHVANTMDDVSGCIGIGMGRGTVNNKWGITSSINGMARLLDIMGNEHKHTLTIRQAEAG